MPSAPERKSTVDREVQQKGRFRALVDRTFVATVLGRAPLFLHFPEVLPIIS